MKLFLTSLILLFSMTTHARIKKNNTTIQQYNHKITNELQTVPHVDLQRYLGIWYDIASFPQSFQKGCSCTTAEYSLNKDGSVKVVNTCRKEGKLKVSKGKARVVDKETNAKLSVTFFWPFKGKYWIIDLADDYSYAVVGHPNRKYLWILSRTKQMNPEIYEGILARIRAKGYDLSKLKKTEQQCK
jgi:apolipoprotein D and lipocalin family protein